MAITPIFEYTPQNATLIAGLLVAFKVGEGEYTAWNGLTDVGDIGNTGSFVEQTSLADRTKRYLAGMKDTAEFEMTYYKYVGDAGQAQLKTLAESGSNISVKMQWPNGDEATFEAAISGYSIVGGGNEDAVRAKVTMRINGDVTFKDAEA